MFAVLGVKPWELNKWRWVDYISLKNGYYAKVESDMSLLRWAVWPLGQISSTKKIDPLKVWPIVGESNDEEMSIEQAKALLDHHRKCKSEGKKSGLSVGQRMRAIEVIQNGRS